MKFKMTNAEMIAFEHFHKAAKVGNTVGDVLKLLTKSERETLIPVLLKMQLIEDGLFVGDETT